MAWGCAKDDPGMLKCSGQNGEDPEGFLED